MRNVLLLLPLLVLSCKVFKKSKINEPLRQWILNNQKQIDLTCDTIINDYFAENKTDSNWTSATIAISKYNPNVLGKLAIKAGDSTDCIIVILSFHKDPNRKKNILIATSDSICLNRLNDINLPPDSADNFTFGVHKEPLY